MRAEELLEIYAEGERNFPKAQLSSANLKGADLSGINLQGATLYRANFSGADLTGATEQKQISIAPI